MRNFTAIEAKVSQITFTASKFIANVTAIFACIILLFLSIGSFLFSTPNTNVIFKYELVDPDFHNIIFVLLGLLFLFIYFFVGSLILKKVKIKTLLKAIVGINFALSFLVVFAFRKMSTGTDASVLLSPLNFESSLGYFRRYPFQIPIALFNNLFVHFLGTGKAVFFLRFFNCFLISLTVYFLFKITHSLFNNDSVDRVFLLLAPLFWQLIFYSTFPYTTIPMICFSTAGTFFMLKFSNTRERNDCIFAILFTFLAICAKPTTVIFVIAFIIFILISKCRVLTRVLIVCVLLLLNSLSSFLFQNVYSAITHNKLDSKYIASSNFALAIGAICMENQCEGNDNFYRNYGYWTSEYSVSTCITKYGAEGCKDVTNSLIKNRFEQFQKHPDKTATFFFEKTKFNWFNPDFGSAGDLMDKGRDYVISGYIPKSHADELILADLQGVSETKSVFRHRLLLFMDSVDSMIFIGALIFAISFVRVKKNHLNEKFEQILLPLIFLGGFAFTLISETGSRYAFCFLPILLPLAAFGITSVCETILHSPIAKLAARLFQRVHMI